jgi:hypothetical protein
MYKQVLAVTPAGTTGAATGSTQVALTNFGRLEAVYLEFGSSVTNDTRINIQFTDPVDNFLTVVSNSGAWYFPRHPVSNTGGTSYTSTSSLGLTRFPMVGTLVARAISSSPVTNAVTAHIYIDED